MRVSSLVLEHIRNHGHSELEPARGVNVFFGSNGQGKTSILEAISLCGLSTTFVPSPDLALIRRGADYAFSSLSAYTDLDTLYKVALKIKPGERKDISSTFGKRLSPQDIIGELPLVILSPDNKNITGGVPQDRRKLLDSVISQASKRYMKDMLDLKRILRQRNALFQKAKTEYHFDYGLIEPWTEALVDVSSEIVVRRHEFIRSFSEFVRQAYLNISGGAEAIELCYAPNALPDELFEGSLPLTGDIRAAYLAKAEAIRREERRRGVTLFGPQKDDVLMMINEGLVRETASQGQHKTLQISIKMAEFAYLKEIRFETPVILLDDVFSELDSHRASNVLEVMRSDAQTFVTTTDARIFYDNFSGNDAHALFEVQGGTVRRV